MSMLQVRDLSDETHQILRERAAKARQSLSAYVAGQLDALARRPTLEEFFAMMDQVPVRDSVGAAEYIRAERDARAEQAGRLLRS